MNDLIKKLTNISLDFSIPKKKKILFYDQNGQSLLKEIIDEEYDIIYSRYEKINFFLFIYSIFKNLFKIIEKKKLFFHYYLTLISYHKPKIIVTYTDNDILFYELKNNCEDVVFLAIQNGYRFYEGDLFEILDKKNLSLKCDFYFAFGKSIKLKLEKYLEGKIVEAGSLKNNYCKKNNKIKKKQICFISSYGISNLNSEKKIIEILIQFAKKYEYSLSLLSRTSNKEEEIFFNKLFGNFRFYYINKTENFCESYYHLDEATLSISLNATLGYENIIRGNKTFFINTNDRSFKNSSFTKFGWPHNFKDEGFFWTKIIDKEIIHAKLSEIIQLDEKNWEIRIRDTISKIISYNENNYIIKSIIKDLLN